MSRILKKIAFFVLFAAAFFCFPFTANAETASVTWMDAQGSIHSPNSYMITVPKSISITGINFGDELDFTFDCPVTVAGKVNPNYYVQVSASTIDMVCGSSSINIISDESVGCYDTSDMVVPDNDDSFLIQGTTLYHEINIYSPSVSEHGTYTGYMIFSSSLEEYPAFATYGVLTKEGSSDSLISLNFFKRRIVK